MAPPGNTPLARPKPRSSEARFEAINRERLRRIRTALTQRQNDFMEMLPLLFHSNHPMLPGYVSQHTPCGIRYYSPTKESIAAAQRVARSYSPERRILPKLEIDGLYMMGSCGTIAYTPGSDFDIWLCHNPNLEEAAIGELRQKAERIEEAARAVDLDVHFFVFSAESFRRGELSTLSAESSGSSQHYLLLDEFYRSAVILAGLYPLWWRVPPDQEANYGSVTARMIEQRSIGMGDYIDFGGLERVPAEEFFGAAVWHIYKSINSPYKSVLKLILIEAYAQEYPAIDLLAVQYKRMVYEGETSLNALDPYMLMYRKVESYLQSRNDGERLNLFRRCFYFKVDEKLSQRSDEDWRREAMQELVQLWGWDRSQLLLLDSRDKWKVPIVLEQRRDLISALTQSYRLLSQFGREQADSARISQRDLHILGRKLYSAFDRKAGKIEIINRGIAPDISEPRLSLHQLPELPDPDRWLLFTQPVAPDEVGQYRAVRRSSSIVDLLSWCHFNGVINDQSTVAAYSAGNPLSSRDVRATLAGLATTFPGGALGYAGSADLTRPPRVMRGALFVNVGVDSYAAERGGDIITSDRTDPLSFGAMRFNLVECLDLVLMTSWEEVFSFHYRGLEGLLHCLCEYLRMCVASPTVPEAFTTHCFSTGHGANIGRRFEQLFADILQCLMQGGNHWRYVLEAADHYYAVVRDENGIRSQRLGQLPGLIAFLSQPQLRFTQTFLDRHALTEHVLPLIYAQNREGIVQTFLRQLGKESKEVDIHVLDERGTLFTQTMPFHNAHVLLDHLARFYRSAAQRMRQEGAADAVPTNLGLEFRQIVPGAQRQHRLEAINYNADLGRRYFQIRVSVDNPDENPPRYSIQCDDTSFTSQAHEGDLFRVVAAHVLSRRQGGEPYPIYITDLELPLQHTDENTVSPPQTARLLEYKRAIEDRLNQTMKEMGVRQAG